MRIHPELGLLLVADGMGGHGHGDVASKVAVDAVSREVEETTRRWRDEESSGGSEARSYTAALASGIEAAHRSVVEAVAADQSLLGMGTTVAGLLVGDDVAAIAHVGDSRVYRLRDGDLQLMTEDHTWVNEQVKAGYLSPEQARTHPLKSVVTRAVGGDHQVEVEVRELEIGEGDLFLLCSDGLTSMLTDDQIRDHLLARASLEDRCRQLVGDANEHGGADNITVILVEFVADEPS